MQWGKMAYNKSADIYRQIPKAFQAKYNQNWSAILNAIGQQDQKVADLVEEVRRQLFINTAQRPYIDRLASNVKVQRPQFVGMDDTSFRQFIPVMSYVPKQVKLIIDQLLDLFYFKESTTSYSQTVASEPFYLEDGWDLSFSLDETLNEYVLFKGSDFVDISQATASEVASSINRQIKNGFAIPYEDSTTKKVYVRIFTGTIGAKGSIRMSGGKACIGLQFDGFLSESGNGIIASWSIQRSGNEGKLTFISGDNPNLQYVQKGDILILNELQQTGSPFTFSGSFEVLEVNLSSNYVKFLSPLAPVPLTPFEQTSSLQVKFFRPYKSTIYKNDRRAAVWELVPGEFDVEIPASPPIVKRKLAGSAHINGLISNIESRVSDTELKISNISSWPSQGRFVLSAVNEIITKNDIDGTIISRQTSSRIDAKSKKYSYSGKSADSLIGITPPLPFPSAIEEVPISSGSRVSNYYTITTSIPQTYRVGDSVVIHGITPSSGLTENAEGGFEVTEIISSTQFKCFSEGDDGTINASLGGTVRVERAGMAATGGRILLLPSRSQTKVLGPYVWDEEARFVLSYKQCSLGTKITAGNQAKIVSTGINELPEGGGYIVFEFATGKEEGPVRYFFKAPDGTMYIDPSYVFTKTHEIGTKIVLVNRFGAHSISNTGKEYSGYNTDASVGRDVLKELIRSVKSAGVFVNFIVRYPKQLYSAFDVYNSGTDPDVITYNLTRGIDS
jgi:hypothetical protein